MNRKPPRPTDAELEILHVLWDAGPCTVREVLAKLPDWPKRGYTTILKLLQIMTEKGLVRRDMQARAHVYTACFAEDQTQQRLLVELLDKAFHGSAAKLVIQALSARPTSGADLAAIRRLLDQMEGDHDER